MEEGGPLQLGETRPVDTEHMYPLFNELLGVRFHGGMGGMSSGSYSGGGRLNSMLDSGCGGLNLARGGSISG